MALGWGRYIAANFSAPSARAQVGDTTALWTCGAPPPVPAGVETVPMASLPLPVVEGAR
jgi:hypothetical protein